jgi:dihydrodipicolinate synthase/N-acetylneuraminate lyase
MKNTGASKMRGIYGITATPFNEDESLDLESLDRVVNFTVESGCHGVVMPVMASEYHTLSDDERKAVIVRTVKAVAGRVPMVAGVSGVSNLHSIGFARFAQDVGADSVIAIPPNSRPTNPGEVLRFFEELNNAVSIPIWIQNHNLGGGLNAAQLTEICTSFENVSYVKEETTFAGHVTTQLLEAAGDRCDGVMGGGSCRNVISEFHREMCGNMPASHFGDPMSKMWDLLDSGDVSGATEVHRRLLPLINFEAIYGVAAFKAVLHSRGLIASTVARGPGRASLDRQDHEELAMLLADIDDLLTWKPS